MKLEPIIQSEVSQKEKDKYHILTHIYEIQKNGTEEFTQRQAKQLRNRYYCGPHKGFGILNKAEIDVFLQLSCFFDDPAVSLN